MDNSYCTTGPILIIFITDKEAEEMKERVNQLLAAHRPTRSVPTMGTFHSVCVRMLREHAPLLGYTTQFTIYDAADQLSLVKKILKELGVDDKQLSPQKVITSISKAKDELKTPELYAAESSNHIAKQITQIYEIYQEKLTSSNVFDFDDLIMQTVLLLQRNERVLAKYHNRFRYILVDEYQDTNTAQYALINILAQKYRNLCVVGDDAQAIYSWRNANFQNILNFERDWPDAMVIKLEQNYRSTQNIVKAASALIKNNTQGYHKELWTNNPTGENISVYEVESEYEEADFILGTIEEDVKAQSHSLNDFVVLYRTNAQSRAIEEAFIRAGMPYKIVGGVKFYQRAEIKDLIAWLRLTANPQDTASSERLEKLRASFLKEKLASAHRTKKSAIEAHLENFRTLTTTTKTLTEFVRTIIEQTHFEQALRDGTEKGEERWGNVLELLSVSEDYGDLPLVEAQEKFLQDVTLAQEADQVTYHSALVHLMTMHMAKGLEFPVVFIAGCEEGILPHANSMLSQEGLEEERRLLYVALTRAKQKAYIIFSRRRMLWGSIHANPPSSFLFEIPQEYLDYHSLDEEGEEDGLVELD